MKKVLMLLCVLFVLMPMNAFAHSKMTESSPAENATVTEAPERISITFNTSISSISTFKVVSENGEEQPVENIKVDNDTLSGDVTASLADGSYSVEWKIVGEDGHAVEGSYSFQVELAEAGEPTPENTEGEQPETTPEVEPTNEPAESATPTETADANNQTGDDEQTAEKSSNPVWPYILVVAIVAVVVVFAMRKRK